MNERLFRAVSPLQLADILAINDFRSVANSLEGKWFAETKDDADRWGQLLYGAAPFHVVQVEIPAEVAALMFRLPVLDQIGPARYADGEVLVLINLRHQGVTEAP